MKRLNPLKLFALLLITCLSETGYPQVTNTAAALKLNNIKLVICYYQLKDSTARWLDSSRYNADGRLIYRHYKSWLCEALNTETYTYTPSGKILESVKNDLTDTRIYNGKEQLTGECTYRSKYVYTDYHMIYDGCCKVYVIGRNNDTSICSLVYDQYGRITENVSRSKEGLPTVQEYKYHDWPSKMEKEYVLSYASDSLHPLRKLKSVKTSADSLHIETCTWGEESPSRSPISRTTTDYNGNSIIVMQYNGKGRLLAKNISYLRADGLIDKTIYYNMTRGEMLDRVVVYTYPMQPE